MSGTSGYGIIVDSLRVSDLSNKRVIFANSTGTLIDNSNLFFGENTLSTDAVTLGTNSSGEIKVTDVSGANISGKDLTISSGRGTGSSVGGDIFLKTATSGSSGSVVNNLETRMYISNNGNIGIGTQIPSSKLELTGDFTLNGGIKFLDVNSYTWTQLGNTLQGESNGDYFGTCIDSNQDASLIIVGGYMNDGNGTDSGHARVFEYSSGSSTWVQKGNDINGEAAGDQSGLNVSISDDGNYVASGAPYNSSGGSNSGHVKIYRWNGSDWGGEGYEWEIVGQASSNFGFTNSLNQDGSRILIGGTGYSSNKGIVEVHELSEGTWSKKGSSLIGTTSEDQFGKWAQISGNGNIIAVGAPEANESGTDRGYVKVYEWNSSSNIWDQKGSTFIGETDSDKLGDRFGLSLSLNGLVLAISSNTANSNDGFVKVYEWDTGLLDWAQVGSTITGDTGSRFGTSVSLNSDGTSIVIGAFSNDDSGLDTGQTQIFVWDGYSWNPRGNNINGVTDYDYNGSDVRISNDGTRIVTSSPQLIGNSNGNKSGLVYVYNLETGSNTTTIKGSTAIESNIIFTLPSNDGDNGDVLTTDGNGNLSWGENNLNQLNDVKSGGTNFTNSIVIGHENIGPLSSQSRNNTAVGLGTMPSINGGADNTLLGFNAGNILTTGYQNTLLGSGSATSSVSGFNQTSVGYGAICSQDNEVSLGNSSVTTLRCATTAIASLSDRRDKTDIIDCNYGLDFVKKLRPVQFTWNRRILDESDIENPNNGKKRLGFIAQDFQNAMPNGENDILDLVNEINPERIEAKYINLIPILTKAIQELQEKVFLLEKKLANK